MYFIANTSLFQLLQYRICCVDSVAEYILSLAISLILSGETSNWLILLCFHQDVAWAMVISNPNICLDIFSMVLFLGFMTDPLRSSEGHCFFLVIL